MQDQSDPVQSVRWLRLPALQQFGNQHLPPHAAGCGLYRDHTHYAWRRNWRRLRSAGGTGGRQNPWQCASRPRQAQRNLSPCSPRLRVEEENMTSHLSLRFLACLALLAGNMALQGCVTETSGGFNVQRSDEQSLKYYLQLATGYLEQNDLASSKRHLANAAAIEPNNSEIHAIWGLLYSREGEARLADESFQHALRLDTRNSKARNNYAAFLFANGRFEEAYDQLERVVQDTEYEARPQAFENLGLAALRLERKAEAEAA